MHVSDFLRLDTMICSEDAESAGLIVEWTEDMGPLNFVSHQWLSSTHPDPDQVQLRTIQQVLCTLSSKDPKVLMSADDWDKYSKTFVDGVDAAVRQQTQGAGAQDEATMDEDEGNARHFAATIAEGYIWLDYHSIPQTDAEKQVQAIESLQEYVSRSTNFWILVPNATHKTSGLLACEESWRRRGWCRFERWCCELRVGDRFRRPLVVHGPHSVSVSNFSDVMILETRSGPMNGEFSMEDDRIYLARLMPGMFDAKLRDLLRKGDLLHYRWLMFVRPHILMMRDGLSSEASVPAQSEQRPALAIKRVKRHSSFAGMRQMLSKLRGTLIRPKLKPDPMRLSWIESDLPVQPVSEAPGRHPVQGNTIDGCGNGDEDLPSFLARYGFSSLSDVSHPTPFFPLFCAAAEGNLAITRALLAAEVDPNMWCALGMNTALHGSCAISGAATTALLLDAKATPHCPSPNGITPMHRAAAVGDAKTVKLMLAAGADALAQRKDTGASPLHSAAGGGHKDVCEILLQHEPQAVALTDHAGRTAEHVLASQSDAPMAIDQLSAIAAPLAKNSLSTMALSEDQLARHHEIRSVAVRRAVEHHAARRRNSLQPDSHDLKGIGQTVDASGSNDDMEA